MSRRYLEGDQESACSWNTTARKKCLTPFWIPPSSTTECGLCVFSETNRQWIVPASGHCQRVRWTVPPRRGKQRLIVDARSVNARMRAPPATPLATNKSFSQFTLVLSERCDPTAVRHRAFTYTCSSASPTSHKIKNIFTSCTYITTSPLNSHLLNEKRSKTKRQNLDNQNAYFCLKTSAGRMQVTAHGVFLEPPFRSNTRRGQSGGDHSVEQRNTFQRFIAWGRPGRSGVSSSQTLYLRRQRRHHWTGPRFCGKHAGRSCLSFQRSRAARVGSGNAQIFGRVSWCSLGAGATPNSDHQFAFRKVLLGLEALIRRESCTSRCLEVIIGHRTFLALCNVLPSRPSTTSALSPIRVITLARKCGLRCAGNSTEAPSRIQVANTKSHLFDISICTGW